MSKDKETTIELSQEVKEQYKESTMGRGAKLAMELNAERKRLKQEMEELQVVVEDLKPTTPTGTIDSHVKWIATVLAVVGVFLQSAGLITEGKIAYAKSKGWIGKQPTNKDKNYLDSVDVYVDPKRFVNVPPSEAYIKTKPPHDRIVTKSVRIPLVDWEKAFGRSGYGLEDGAPKVFNLTLAGWWDAGTQAYVNPNNKKLNKIIYSYYK